MKPYAFLACVTIATTCRTAQELPSYATRAGYQGIEKIEILAKGME